MLPPIRPYRGTNPAGASTPEPAAKTTLFNVRTPEKYWTPQSKDTTHRHLDARSPQPRKSTKPKKNSQPSDGRQSCPPTLLSQSYVNIDKQQLPFKRLEEVMAKAVSRATEDQGGQVTQGFDALAEHIERYRVDDCAEVVDQCCSEWIQDALDKLPGDDIISEDLAKAAAMALDQLLSLLLYREPNIQAIVQATREVIHRSIFTSTKGAASANSVFPKLLKHKDPLAVEELQDEYRGQHSYFTATNALLQQNEELANTEANLRRAVEHHMKSTIYFQRQQRKQCVGKAFYAWAVQSRKDKESRLLRTTAIHYTDKAKQLDEEVLHTKTKAMKAQQSMENRVSLLENDRHTMRQTYDSFQAIAERSRRDLAMVKEQLRMAEANSAAMAQQQIFMQQQLALRWKKVAQSKSLSPADNAFENYNRSRVEAVTQRPPSEQSLMTWCDDMCRDFGDYPRTCFGNYDGKRVSASYLMLLHSISPGDVPYTNVSLAMESGPQAQGEALTHHLLSMNLAMPSLTTSQMHRRPREEHILLMSAIFARFCGMGATQPLLPPNAELDLHVWQGLDGFSFAMENAAVSNDDPNRDPTTEELRHNKALQQQERWQLTGCRMVAALGKDAVTAVKAEDDYSAEESEAYKVYHTLNMRRVVDAFSESRSEVESVVSDVLVPNASSLRRVYIFYATGGMKHNRNPAMSLEEFHLLCTESKLVANKGAPHLPGIKPQQISSIFVEATQNANQMLPKHFAEAIVRLAVAVPWKENAAEGTRVEEKPLTEKVEGVVVHRMLRYANGVAMENFKQQLRSGAVGEMVEEVRPILKKIFRHYSAEDAGGDNNELSEKEFLRLCTETKLVDEVCTHQALQQLFTKIPDSAAAAADAASGRYDSTDASAQGEGLGFDDFLEVMCAIALFKNPSPFVSFHQKVRRFVDSYLSNHASTLRKK